LYGVFCRITPAPGVVHPTYFEESFATKRLRSLTAEAAAPWRPKSAREQCPCHGP
jgi:hypothetical protein